MAKKKIKEKQKTRLLNFVAGNHLSISIMNLDLHVFMKTTGCHVNLDMKNGELISRALL